MADYLPIIVGVMALIVLYTLWLRVLAPKFAGVKKIDMVSYKEMFRKQSHLLLDVRSDSEFAAAHAPKAKHIPVETIARSTRSEMDALIKGKPVVCICASGSRSKMAATVIARLGFKPVYTLSGGMSAWQAAGETVKRSRS
ncbi:MAG TPA: rhodanese-like domain-containing protein [Mariprofundaceae bacterium]|nr:rhodanese-like domain-containing protein [Mariprofundaceae bacterium]